MKASVVLASVLVCGFSLAAQSALSQSNNETLVRYRDLDKPYTIDSLLTQGDATKTFEFMAGDRIPVEVKFQSDVFSVEQDAENIALVVKTPFLLKFASEPYISFDSVRFIPLTKAFTGSYGFSFGSDSDADTKPSLIRFSGELNRKNVQ